jgi:hypothetical protein
LYSGDWAEFARLEQEVSTMRHSIHEHSVWEDLNFHYAPMILNNWEEAEQRVETYAKKVTTAANQEKQFPLVIEFRSRILAHRGEHQRAIDLLKSVLPEHNQLIAVLAPLPHSLIALWQAISGNLTAALPSADNALHLAKAPGVSKLAYIIVITRCAAIYGLAGKNQLAKRLLIEAIDLGLGMSHTMYTFTALYHLVAISSDQLPKALFVDVLKRATVSPAMQFEERPLACALAAAQRIQVKQNERASLWATDLTRTKMLAEEVLTHISSASPLLQKTISSHVTEVERKEQ